MSNNKYNEIIAIGDIHGRKQWREIINQNPDAHIVFMGDYCDPYQYISTEKLLCNLNDIIKLKLEDPDRFTLLIGNHDMHYITKAFPRGSRYDWRIADDMHDTLLRNHDAFCMAWQYRNVLFTHSGVSQHWIDTCFHRNITPNAAEIFNNPDINEEDKNSLFACGEHRGGPDLYSGIFWADIKELDLLPEGLIQVAGHNWVKEVTHIHSASADNDTCADIIICDCLASDRYLRITDNEDIISFYEMYINEDKNKLIMQKNTQYL